MTPGPAMTRWPLGVRAGLLALGLVLSVYAFLLARGTGLMRAVPETGTQACRLIDGPAQPPLKGPEDFAIDRKARRMWISSADRNGVEYHGRAPMGAIFLMDLDRPTAPLRRVDPMTPDRFYPHGLGLWTDPDSGAQRLFVVDHGASGKDHRIRIFDILPDGRLRLAETVADAKIVRPNDVAPVGPDRFFATNDLGGWTEGLRRLEPYLLAPWSSLVYWDGSQAHWARRGLRYANGVLHDPNRDRLYLAQVLDRSVTAFALDPDGGLDRIWKTSVAMGVDNLTLDPAGDILAAGHPRPLEFTRHAKAPLDPDRPSSSEVVRLTAEAGRMARLHLNRGALYSGASVAQIDKGRLFIGSVFQTEILLCDFAPSQS